MSSNHHSQTGADTSQSLRILAALGFVLIGSLMVAERAGLPETLFTQLFLIIIAAVIGGIALGTRTLDGAQFFRPALGGSAITRGVAIASLTGAGMVPIALPTIWHNEPHLGVALALAIACGGLLFIGLLAPALDRSNAPDLARLAVPDSAHPALRLLVYGVALGTVLAALGAVTAYLMAFEDQQTLIPGNFITNGAMVLALAVALLGGRAGVVRLAALSLPLAIAAGVGTAAIGAGLELPAFADLSNNDLLVTTSSQTSAILPQTAFSFAGWALIACTALGLTLGNLGASQNGAVVRTPLPFFIALAGCIVAVATVAAIAPSDIGTQEFLIYALAEDLQLPIVFKSAGAAAIAAMLCASVSAAFFACASITLRGIAPIFTQRRQPGGRQLFRARLLMLALGGAAIFTPPQLSVSVYGTVAFVGLGTLATMCFPILMTGLFGFSQGTAAVLLAWAIGLASMVGTVVFLEPSTLMPTTETTAAATLIGAIIGAIVLALIGLVSRVQLRKRATI